MDRWLPILKRLKLNRSEQAVVERYQADPKGRTFLAVADLLRNQKLVDESLELLMEGVDRHPSFTVARVVLAREFFQKGMVAEAWQYLQRSPEPLTDNVLAAKLRLKLAIILNKASEARAINEEIRLRRMYDDETQILGEALRTGNFARLRAKLIEDTRQSGVPLVVDEASVGVDELGRWPYSPPPPPGETPSGESEPKDYSHLEGFHVVSLREVFVRDPAEVREEIQKKLGVELDSTTLAGIYEKQGHYAKAIDIYRRMLKLAPHSDFLRRKVAELTRARKEQKTKDQEVDAELVDRMENLEIIERQIKYLYRLLERLGDP